MDDTLIPVFRHAGQQDKRMLRHSHGSKDIGAQGKSIIEKLQDDMDRQRKKLEAIVTKYGKDVPIEIAFQFERQRGRYEGIAASLARMRNSSVAEEISRSDERLGIEQ